MAKTRLDVLLVNRGLVDSRSLAQRMIMAGQVRVDDQIVLKPSIKVDASVQLSVDRGPKYVSRGGEKLAAAINHFSLMLSEKICADVGASTGGFTDCMLQNGASRVYAIDVGRGILDWKLRQDKRVIVIEHTNARYIDELAEKVNFITIDASFISLKLLLPIIRNWYPMKGGEAVVLVKPQFEAGRELVKRGKGVIRDPETHFNVLIDVLDSAQKYGYCIRGLIKSPIKGPKGNQEFLAWLAYPSKEKQKDLEILVRSVVSIDSPELES